MKLLEVVMEHVLFHYEDIVDLLLDEMILEEVQERNTIEAKLEGKVLPEDEVNENQEEPEEVRQERILDRKREIDLREIMRVFEDYKRVEESIANRL